MPDRKEWPDDNIKDNWNNSDVIAVLFILSLFIYFFNLDMKFASKLIKPLTAYYNWSKNRREADKKNK